MFDASKRTAMTRLKATTDVINDRFPHILKPAQLKELLMVPGVQL